MTTAAVSCESCGMPLATAADHALGDAAIPYCAHCTDGNGALQPRDERLERFTQWSMRQDGLDYVAARQKAIEYMKTRPAWRHAFD
jgi:hypothetical protein